MSVYKCINAVQAAIAKDGLAKSSKNKQQGWSFRGIDDLYNTLSPVLADKGLCIIPRVLSHSQTERQTRNGGVMITTILDCEFDFICAEDGSKHTAKVYGEASDTSDKSTNKAMSVAYKYACFQVFAIPTEGDNDPDATVIEPQYQPSPALEELKQLAKLKHFNIEAYAKKNGLNSSSDIPESWYAQITENLSKK